MLVSDTHGGPGTELDQANAREPAERCGPVRVPDRVPGKSQGGAARSSPIRQSPIEDRLDLAGQIRAGAGDRLPEGLIGPDGGDP